MEQSSVLKLFISGQGGGSYLHPMHKSFKKQENGSTSNPGNGFIKYRFYNLPPVRSIRLGKAVSKSIDLTGGADFSGTNIRLWSYSNLKRQQWSFELDQIKLSKNMTKCLDLTSNNTSNGANIQLWDCNGDGAGAQDWIYDGINRSIRLKKNLTKCIDLSAGNTSNGTNIQLWDCVGKKNQQWQLTELTNPLPKNPKNKQIIRLAKDQNKCIDLSSGNTSNGTNIQLWNCGTTNTNQQWLFDSDQIKLNKDQSKCLDVTDGILTASNGMNIQLLDCIGTDAQKWIYDGVTNAIRLKKHPNYCIDLSHGTTSNGSNIQLWKCGQYQYESTMDY